MSFNFSKNEKEILDFWDSENIFQKLQEKNKGNQRWSFLDGPITANNPMGVHHGWGRTYKDLFQRYKAMRGFDQRYQNGFDCQGLWVEVEVEKELGFENKKDIEEYGIGKFVKKCKERVRKYSGIQTEQSKRLGQWMDWENSYFTMSEENNYSIWHFLKECGKRDLIYKGTDVVPWCSRCGTAISQHEMNTEEYKEVIHKAVFIKVKLEDKDCSLLAWTTTPWTLPANVSLAVNPDLDYVKVNSDKGENIIVAEEAKDLVEGEVKKKLKGEELIGEEYVGFFDELRRAEESLEGKAHKVIPWNEVSEEEGTGVVHIAPGCGEEDYQLSQELDLPIVNPTQEESKYKEGFGELSGKFVNSDDVRGLIFEKLKEKGLLYKVEDYTHRYPQCWRCKEELIFRLVDEWYINMDPLREGLKEAAKDVEWIPSYGLDRELDWLENMDDWLISKKRYWGLSLPIFECSKCGNFEVIGSKEELKERSVEGWEEFEGHTPHRPWVDEVKIKCSNCGKTVSRVEDVGTPWLDAGIIPFSTLKYFSNREYWKKWFPVDFVCESLPGQIKNWFYALLVMSYVLEETNPFETLLGYKKVLDENGEEMHKSKGNAIWFDDAVDKMGADVMRWMYTKANPRYNLKFGYNIANEVKRKLLTLWNSYVFFDIYSSKEKVADLDLEDLELTTLDEWVLSRLNKTIKEATEGLEDFSPSDATEAIEEFFMNDLSQWYIRRSRDRFKSDEDGEDKKAAQAVLYRVLLKTIKVAAPMIPFLTEKIYQNLKVEGDPKSVHLLDWPDSDSKWIKGDLEKNMKKAREVVSEGLSIRKENQIKVRQPLSSIAVDSSTDLGDLEGKEELLALIKEEVNVKEIEFVDLEEKKVTLDTKVTSQLKKEGNLREIVRNIQHLRKKCQLTPTDEVPLYYSSDSELAGILKENKEDVLGKTRCTELKEWDENKIDKQKEVEIDGEKLKLGLKEK